MELRVCKWKYGVCRDVDLETYLEEMESRVEAIEERLEEIAGILRIISHGGRVLD